MRASSRLSGRTVELVPKLAPLQKCDERAWCVPAQRVLGSDLGQISLTYDARSWPRRNAQTRIPTYSDHFRPMLPVIDKLGGLHEAGHGFLNTRASAMARGSLIPRSQVRSLPGPSRKAAEPGSIPPEVESRPRAGATHGPTRPANPTNPLIQPAHTAARALETRLLPQQWGALGSAEPSPHPGARLARFRV